MLTGIGNQAQIEGEIVDRRNLHGQQLLGFKEVVEIGLGMNQELLLIK